LANGAPFEVTPSLRRVFRADKNHDEFRLRAVETREIHIQVDAREFSFVVFVVEHPLLAEGGGEPTGHLSHEVSMLARKREGNSEAARARRSSVIEFVASDGLKLFLRRRRNSTDKYWLISVLQPILSLALATASGNTNLLAWRDAPHRQCFVCG
jgi:hypothetical protein